MKAFERLDASIQKRIHKALLMLLEDLSAARKALRGDHKSLVNRAGERRLRVGDWRVIYRLEHARLVVLVLDLGSRGQVY